MRRTLPNGAGLSVHPQGCGSSTPAVAVSPPATPTAATACNKAACQSLKVEAAAVTDKPAVAPEKPVSAAAKQLSAAAKQVSADTSPTADAVIPAARQQSLQDSLDANNLSGAIHLPAESGTLSEPELRGQTERSGPSFKIRRGSVQMQTPGKLSDLDVQKKLVYSDDLSDVLKGMEYFQTRLSEVPPPPAGFITSSGLLPRFVELLKRNDARQVQTAAVWTLTNICSGTHEDTQQVVDQGAVPELIRLLSSCDDVPDLLQQAMWALGNIAADCEELQRMVLDEQVVAPLLGAAQRHAASVPILRHSMWLLANLSRPKPQSIDLAQAMPMLLNIINSNDQDHEVQVHACWALAYLTALPQVIKQLAAGSAETQAAIQQLVRWVSAPLGNLTDPALRVLGSLCAGTPEQAKVALDAGTLSAAKACLHASRTAQLVGSQKEALSCLGHIAAGEPQQVQALLDEGVFVEVLELVQSSGQGGPDAAEGELVRECVVLLAKPWSSSLLPPQLSQALLDAGIALALLAFLDANRPPHIIQLALDGVADAMKRGQQIMQAAAKAAAAAAATAAAATTGEGMTADVITTPTPAPVNPISAQLKKHGVAGKLQALFRHPDSSVGLLANRHHTMLQFL